MYKLYFLIFFASSLSAQISLNWSRTIGGNLGDYVNKIVSDKELNVYGVGSFQDTINNLISIGNTDVFVFKYDKDGNLLWKIGFGSTSDDVGNDIAADTLGNIFITGYYRNTLYYNNDSLPYSGDIDAFFAKIDSSGNIVFIKNISTSKGEIGNTIICDLIGNVYVGGTFVDSLNIDGNLIDTFGNRNNFIVKFDSNGSYIWHCSFSTPIFNNLYDLKLDSLNNLYFTGTFRDYAISSIGQIISYGNNDILFGKIDTNGQLLWWKKIGSTFSDLGNAIEIENDKIYISGVVQDTAYFDAAVLSTDGEFDAFLAQYDINGNFNWVQSVRGIDNSKAFDVSANGNFVFLAGYFEGTAYWGTDSATSKSMHVPSDIFLVEYLSDGSYSSLKTYGGFGTDYASSLTISANSLFLGGGFMDTINFESELQVSHNNGSDIFLCRFDKNINTSIFHNTFSNVKFNIYPNPVTEILNIEFELSDNDEIDLSLFNISGMKIFDLIKGTYYSGNYHFCIPLSGLSQGEYFLRLNSPKNVFVKKIIVL